MIISIFFVLAGSIFYTILRPPKNTEKTEPHILYIKESTFVKGVEQNG